MSNMLEQAIVDAAALREAALKNAEQSIIEKYSPQIKEAVNKMLEGVTTHSKMKHEGQVVDVIHEADEDGGKGNELINTSVCEIKRLCNSFTVAFCFSISRNSPTEIVV